MELPLLLGGITCYNTLILVSTYLGIFDHSIIIICRPVLSCIKSNETSCHCEAPVLDAPAQSHVKMLLLFSSHPPVHVQNPVQDIPQQDHSPSPHPAFFHLTSESHMYGAQQVS